jgi:hypothetical protein
MNNALLSRSCYLLGMLLALVWGFADSLHTLRHPQGRSRFTLVQSVFFLICCSIAVLLMIVLACFGRLSLPVLQ